MYLPRFINFQDDAEKALVLETAASFAAIKLAQAKWYASGNQAVALFQQVIFKLALVSK